MEDCRSSPCVGQIQGLLLLLMDQDSDAVSQLRRLLEEHVPDVASGVVRVRGLARKVGIRSLIVVEASDPAVYAVGAVVG
jgi:transcription antitermination factor NusA-like protein